MSVKEQLATQLKWRAESLAAIVTITNACEGLGIADADFYLDCGDTEYIGDKRIEGPYIKLSPRHVSGIAFGISNEGPTLEVVDTTPTLSDAARILLPKVGKWEKSFDGEHNLIQLTGYYRGVRVVLEDTPPDTCTVHKIEEEVEVLEQVVAAHTEKKVRYVLEGDCDPLMTARDAVQV